MPAIRQLELEALEAKHSRHLVEQFGQRTERTQPAAEEPTSPDEDGEDDEDPEDEDERIGEEQFPGPMEQHRVEPGQHLGDRRHGEHTEADETDADDPGGVLEEVDGPLVAAARTPGQFVAQRVDNRDHHEQRAEHGEFGGARAPDADPGRLGFDHRCPPAFEVARRHPLLGRETHELAVAALVVELVGEEHELPRPGRAETGVAHDEDRGFPVGRRTRRLDAPQIQVIEIAEGVGVHLLRDLDAVVDATAHEAGAFERFRAVGRDKDRVLTFLQPAHQAGVCCRPENAAAHGRRIQVAEVHVDVRRILSHHADFFGPHAETADAAFLEHLRPIQGLVDGREAHGRLLLGLQDADLPRNRNAGAHDDLVLRDHGDGGAGDRIEADGAVAALADFNLVANEAAEILVDEFRQRFFRDPEQQNRFAVTQDARAGEHAGLVHADQRDDRFAGIRGNVDDVGRQEHVAQEFARAAGAAIAFDIGRLALALGEAVCAGQHIGAGHVGAEIRIGGEFCRHRRVVRAGASGCGRQGCAAEYEQEAAQGRQPAQRQAGPEIWHMHEVVRGAGRRCAGTAAGRRHLDQAIPVLTPAPRSCAIASRGAAHDRSACSSTSTRRAYPPGKSPISFPAD